MGEALKATAAETHYRAASVDAERAVKGAITVSISSDAPVERSFGKEVLDHTPGAIRLALAKAQGLPALLDHSRSQVVGRLENPRIENGRLRFDVRPGNSTLAKETWADVRDGILPSMSVGYRIYEAEQRDDGSILVTDWEPLEGSFVAIPADPSVGVNRSSDKERGHETMPEPVKKNDNSQDAAAAERERASTIAALGDQFNMRGQAAKAIADGTPVDEFRKTVLDSVRSTRVASFDPADALFGAANSNDVFSFKRALERILDGGRLDGFERECSDEMAKRMGRKPEAAGFFAPSSALQMRATMVAGTANIGGNLVGTDHRPDLLIPFLHNRTRVLQLGATVLNDLQGDVAIPKVTGTTTAAWVAEDAAAGESNLTLGSVPLSPKQVTANAKYSRKLLVQSSPGIEDLLRGDIQTQLGLAIDLAAINGSGAANQPAGILNTAGIGDVPGGTNGLAPSWDHIVDLEGEIADANADMGRLGYLTNSAVRKVLKKTTKVDSDAGAGFVWEAGTEPGYGRLNGYRAAVSNQVPRDLDKGTAVGVCSAIIYGNWADLLIGEWGGMEVIVDPYTEAAKGNVIIAVHYFVDITVRHAASFAAMQDALTQ